MRSSPFAEGLGPAALYFAFRAAAWIAERAPIRLSDRVAGAGGRIGYYMSRGKREIVKSNLRRVVGEGPHLDAVVRDAFASYARYWLETFRLGRYSPEDLLEMVIADDESIAAVTDALDAGHGVVMATAHIGFYDLGVAWVGTKGWPFSTVGEVLKPRALFEWFAAIRERRGMRVIPAKPGAQARQTLAERVRAAEGVAVLSDRDLGRRGVWAEFFGERTTLPAGPALLVINTGAPLLVGVILQEPLGAGPDRYRIIFRNVPYELIGKPDADLEAMVQLIARELEKLIRLAPEQWHLFSTNWPSDEPTLPPRGRRAEELKS